MGLFSFLSDDGRFVSEEQYHENLESQETKNALVLGQLRENRIGPEAMKKLEYFFYTNTLEKASSLVNELQKLGYEVGHDTAPHAGQFVINGWTDEMQISPEVVNGWSKKMIILGNQLDCYFDGWGTNV